MEEGTGRAEGEGSNRNGGQKVYNMTIAIIRHLLRASYMSRHGIHMLHTISLISCKNCMRLLDGGFIVQIRKN